MSIASSGPGFLLPYRVDEAPLAMALDDAMLELAQEGVATLRTYGWSGPNLTLGYFQKSQVRFDLGHQNLPWARRSTGGEALLHHHEWTYAFALPAEHPLSRTDPAHLTRLIHGALSLWLRESGIPARLHEGTDSWQDHSGLCFQHWSPGDLLLGPSKIMGSAQRRRKGTLLQHGGLLYRQSPAEKRLQGIEDLSQNGPGLSDWANQMAGVLAKALDGDWSPGEESLVTNWLGKGFRLKANHESQGWLEKR